MIAIPNMDKPQSCDECVKSLDIECCGDIRNCPLLDIVYCVECVHKDNICHFCYEHERNINDNDFCSYGKRRNDEKHR